jgi:hypothetical protein
MVCDVETHVSLAASQPPRDEAEPTAPRRSGPAQVASDAYRENWDIIYKKKKEPELLN